MIDEWHDVVDSVTKGCARSHMYAILNINDVDHIIEVGEHRPGTPTGIINIADEFNNVTVARHGRLVVIKYHEGINYD